MGVTYLSMPYTKSTSSSTTSGLTSAKITCLSFRGSRPRPPKIGNFTASSKLSTGWRRPLSSSRTASACEVTFMHSQILTWSELVVWLEQLMKYTWLLSLCNFSTLLINHALFRNCIPYERVTKLLHRLWVHHRSIHCTQAGLIGGGWLLNKGFHWRQPI